MSEPSASDFRPCMTMADAFRAIADAHYPLLQLAQVSGFALAAKEFASLQEQLLAELPPHPLSRLRVQRAVAAHKLLCAIDSQQPVDRCAGLYLEARDLGFETLSVEWTTLWTLCRHALAQERMPLVRPFVLDLKSRMKGDIEALQESLMQLLTVEEETLG